MQQTSPYPTFLILYSQLIPFLVIIVDFFPNLSIYSFGEKGKQGLGHGVAANITFECCYSSLHI